MADTTQTQPTDGAGAPPQGTAPTTPTTDAAGLQAELESFRRKAAELEEKLRKTNDENAKRRIAEKEARDRAEAEARQKGEHEKVIKSLEERLAEAEKEIQRRASWEDGHKNWSKYLENESTAIEAKLPSMEPHWQAAIKAAPSLEAKKAILAARDAEVAARAAQKPPVEEKKPANPAPAGGAPAGTPPPQVLNAGAASPEELRSLKESNPDAYYAAIGGKQSVQQKKTGLFGRVFTG
jgi:chromosome segregation ATPase